MHICSTQKEQVTTYRPECIMHHFATHFLKTIFAIFSINKILQMVSRSFPGNYLAWNKYKRN